MKCKTILIPTLLMLLLVVIVYAGDVECEISTDNITFTTIDSTLYGGCIDNSTTDGLGYIQNLEPDTLYYIRCKEEGVSGWAYISQKTESGGINEKMIAAIMGFLGMGLFFFILAWHSKAIGLKILGYTVTAIQLLMGLFIIYINETGESMVEILRINFMLLLVVFGGMLLIVLANFFIRLVNPSDTQDEEADALKWQGKESKWYKNV